MALRRLGERGGTYEHVQGIVVLETRDHGSDEGVSCDACEHVSLIPYVFDLLETDH